MEMLHACSCAIPPSQCTTVVQPVPAQLVRRCPTHWQAYHGVPHITSFGYTPPLIILLHTHTTPHASPVHPCMQQPIRCKTICKQAEPTCKHSVPSCSKHRAEGDTHRQSLQVATSTGHAHSPVVYSAHSTAMGRPYKLKTNRQTATEAANKGLDNMILSAKKAPAGRVSHTAYSRTAQHSGHSVSHAAQQQNNKRPCFKRRLHCARRIVVLRMHGAYRGRHGPRPRFSTQALMQRPLHTSHTRRFAFGTRRFAHTTRHTHTLSKRHSPHKLTPHTTYTSPPSCHTV